MTGLVYSFYVSPVIGQAKLFQLIYTGFFRFLDVFGTIKVPEIATACFKLGLILVVFLV